MTRRKDGRPRSLPADQDLANQGFSVVLKLLSRD